MKGWITLHNNSHEFDVQISNIGRIIPEDDHAVVNISGEFVRVLDTREEIKELIENDNGLA